MSWFVTVMFNTEADGSPVKEGTTSEDWPRCHYGPFPDEAAATHWLEEVYPDGDTDVEDLWAHTEPTETLGYVNPPETVVARYGDGPLGLWTQGVQP